MKTSEKRLPFGKGEGRRPSPQSSPARDLSDDIPSATRKSRRVRTRNAEGSDRQDSPSFVCPRPSTRFSDAGGTESILNSIRELQWASLREELYAHIGVEPSRGVLLYGPSGCGKTLVAHAIAGEIGYHVSES